MALVGDESLLYRPRPAVYAPPRPGASAAIAGVTAPPKPATTATAAAAGAATPAAGSQIPGAGVYLQNQALAQQAYDQAMADIQHRRNAMYSEFGLMPGGAVDPHAKFGRYQQMLGGDASALAGAKASSRSRGLGMTGLGARAMQRARTQMGAEHFGFQNALTNNLYGFDQDALKAGQNKNAAMLAAEQAQAQWALQNQMFTPAGGGGTGGGGVVPPPSTAVLKTATPAPATRTTKAALAKAMALRTVASRRRPS